MTINTTTLEANLTTKINNTSGTTDGKEFLLLGKAVEAVNTAISNNSLRPSNNLSDVANAATARENLSAAPIATIAVTVVSSGGNKFALDGTAQQTASLTPSVTYRFDQSHSSNAGHPLLLSTTSNGTHGGGSAFTTGVTSVGTPGQAGAYTQVILEQDAPDPLYYYCSNHSGMGGQIDSSATVSSLTDLGVTSTATELNILDGVTATTAELNILDGVTATAAELNILDGVTATAAEINYNDITTLGLSQASKAVTADANGVVSFDNGTIEESTAITSSSNAATINLRDGNVFTHTLTENVTYTFSNPAASGRASAFILKVTQDSSARTITWPGSVDWAAATAPTLTTTNAGVDVFAFLTVDGGTTYYGFTLGQAMG